MAMVVAAWKATGVTLGYIISWASLAFLAVPKVSGDLHMAGRKRQGGEAKPLHERIEAVERNKQERLMAKAAAEGVRLAQLTAPAPINARSARLAAAAASRPADAAAIPRRPKSDSCHTPPDSWLPIRSCLFVLT